MGFVDERVFSSGSAYTWCDLVILFWLSRHLPISNEFMLFQSEQWLTGSGRIHAGEVNVELRSYVVCMY